MDLQQTVDVLGLYPKGRVKDRHPGLELIFLYVNAPFGKRTLGSLYAITELWVSCGKRMSTQDDSDGMRLPRARGVMKKYCELYV